MEEKQVVFVTGGSRGIGKCIAENLAKEGYNVVLNHNKSVKEAKKIKADSEKKVAILEDKFNQLKQKTN